MSRQAAKDHFTTTHGKSFVAPGAGAGRGRGARPEFGSGVGMATLRPGTSSTAASGRFNEASRASDGRIHSTVNHFEPGADAFTYGGFEPTGRSAFGSTGARFVESTVVHQGLIDGYTASEIARGIKPGRLVSSNATSVNNPLATSVYEVTSCGSPPPVLRPRSHTLCAQCARVLGLHLGCCVVVLCSIFVQLCVC